MANSKKNILKFCFFWVLTSLLLIPSVSAEEVNVGYVTNNTEVLMDIPSSGAGAPINLPVNTANSYGNIFQLWVNVSNLSITPDYIYQLELRTPNASLTNITTLQILANNGQICNPLGFTDLTNGYPKIYFSCKSAASYISIYLYNNTGSTSPITTAQNFRWNYAYLRYFTEDTDIDLGPVISNQQQNTQQIINNQNQLLGSQCSNEWNPTLKTATTHRGITFTPVLKNGVVEKYVINGTRTSGSNAYATMMNNFTLHKGTHIKVYSDGNIYLQLYDGTNVINTKDYTATETKTWSQLSIFTTQSPIDNADFKVMISSDSSAPFCLYGTYNSKLDDVSGAIGGVTDAITDNDIGDSTSDASDFITNFNTNTFGLTSIVTAPLTLIQSLTSSACTDLELPLPFLNNKKLTLPCMTTIYSTYFGSFFTIYQTITYGIIAYWVIVRIFNQVKDFKNPEHDEIEVVDL